jgi:hypothetical protein
MWDNKSEFIVDNRVDTRNLFRLTWVSYQLKTKMGLKKISLISIYLNNDIVMGISL